MPVKVKKNYIKRTRKEVRREWRHILAIRQSKWFKWIAYPALGLAALTLLIVLISPALFPPIKPYNFGVSFSAKRSMELGLVWQDNYTALLDDLGIRDYRLMSYWNEHEKQRGQLDFADLDWQMDEAAKRGAKVSLALGLRQPRWPECHEPEWAKELGGHEWKQALYAYMEIVVKRYENHPALESWQLENEYFNSGFGQCFSADRERLEEEFALVDSLSDKPIWLSLADQHGIPVRGPVPESYGYSIYRLVYNDKVIPGYIWYPTPMWYHHLRTTIIKAIHPTTELFIHELQLEPWGPKDTSEISVEEQNQTMDYDQIHKNVTFARQVGFEDIYTWGGEWWYWRKQVYGDHAIWEAVRREVEASRRQQ